MLLKNKEKKITIMIFFSYPVIIFIALLSLFIVAWLVIYLSPSRVKHMFFPSIFISSPVISLECLLALDSKKKRNLNVSINLFLDGIYFK